MNFSVAILIICGSLVKTTSDYSIYFGVTGVFGICSYLLIYFKFELKEPTTDNKVVSEDMIELKEHQ